MELVPFKSIASLLNKDLEIQVEGLIYKITKFGTFIITPEKYNKALIIIDGLYKSNYSFTKNSRKLPLEQLTDKNDEYITEPGILRIDTYKGIDQPEDEMSESLTYGIVSSFNSPSASTPNVYEVPANVIIKTGYTDNKVFSNWNRRFRLHANMHRYNYGMISPLSIALKAQYRGWTGFWRKAKLEQLYINVVDYTVRLRKPLRHTVPIGVNKPGDRAPLLGGKPGEFCVMDKTGQYIFHFQRSAEAANTNNMGIIFMGVPEALTSGKAEVLSINLGCYGRDGKSGWRGIEYFQQPIPLN